MPRLPSGREIAINAESLGKLLAESDHYGNVHEIMAIKCTTDLFPYINFVQLEYQDEPVLQEMAVGSIPMDAHLAPMGAGELLSKFEETTENWSSEDISAFLAFIHSERISKYLSNILENVFKVQDSLRSSPNPTLQILAAWMDEGCHPLQETWDDLD